MATIKDIAKLTGLSPSTVSIVISGKSEERKIPVSTQEKILTAARTLGYQPSMSARRLKSAKKEDLQIVVFWAQDFRANMMVRFLSGVRHAMEESERPTKLMVTPYLNDSLEKERALTSLTDCHAAIICNASAQDMEFLENIRPMIPVVLYNRHSSSYCTVNVNDEKMGVLAARALIANHCRRPAVLFSTTTFPGMELRSNGFLNECKKNHIAPLPTIECDSSMQGGYLAIQQMLASSALPDGIFCSSDSIALGAMKALFDNNIQIPKDIRIVSIGNGDREQEAYAISPLSVVHLPMEQMACECFHLLLNLLDGKVSPPYSKEVPVHYVPRESCGKLD